ncbi:MAG: response regulator [Deltaproteobacteria bacterium]|nr:response regulator [Deltaproteobacteria bacterium]
MKLTGPTRKLLVVDDNVSILETIEDIFKDTGVEVIIADNPIHALYLFKTQHPQVVLADLNLKTAMDGVTMAQKMKMTNPLTIVFALSGMLSMFEASYLRGAGIDSVMAKPVDADRLRQIARTAFQEREEWEKLP